MIIGGGSRGMTQWFSNYLTKERPDEIVRLIEIRGLPVDNIPDAFEELELMASASQQCQNFMYHAHINPRLDERLSDAQWGTALDTLEHNLGLDRQPRLVVEHEKEDGRIHRHVIWSRIDPDTMKAIPDSHNFRIHMKTADELEKLFGHERTDRGRGPDGPNPADYEVFRGRESGIDAHDVKAELAALFRQSDTGRAFAAALEEHGYILAKGDRRDFVVIDQAGDDHALGKKKLGVKAADIRARMADIDRDALPSVEEARKMARSRPVEPSSIAPEVPQPDAAPAPVQGDRAAENKCDAQKHDAASHLLTSAAQDAALDEFELLARDLMRSMREGKPEKLSANPEEWGEQFARSMQSNGDGLNFWQRTKAQLAVMRDRVTGWVKQTWTGLVGRFTDRQSRRDIPDPGLER